VRHTGECLEENTVVDLLRGTLPAGEVARVDAHIDQCAACRQLLSSLAGRDPTADPFSATEVASSRHGSRSAASAASGPRGKGSPGRPTSPVLADRFELGELVGAGGMGEVYRAHDRETGGPVAVKIVQVLGDREKRRFEREADLLAQLAHPAIVRYVAHGVAPDGTPFLAMEWLDGHDLADRLARGALTIAQTIHLGHRIADALAAAHAHGVIHRDVKPSNIFLRDGDVERATVVDFGVARATRSEDVATAATTRTGTLLGTLGYMAPEQARGARNADARADVFSLGCVLFECLTGVRAFGGTDAVEVLARVLTEPARHPHEIVPDVPAALDALVVKMLAKDPALRPPDCVSVSAELARLLDAPWDEARPTPAPVPARDTPVTSPGASSAADTTSVGTRRRGRAAGWLGMAAAIAAGALLGPKLVGRGDARQTEDSRSAAAVTATMPPPTAAPPSGPISVLILGIENLTSDPIFDGTLDDALSASLIQSPSMDPFQGHYLRALAKELKAPRIDEGMADLLARRSGGRVVTVRGSVASKGAGYALSITATDADKKPLATSALDAPNGARVIPTLARLACDLRAAIGDRPTCDPALAERTSASSSLEADHEFTVGRGLADSGKYNDAIAHLQRAVELDPEFAKAHQTLGIFLANAGRPSEANAEMKQAFQHVDRFCERERLRFLGDYYSGLGDYDQAIPAYEELFRRRPDDVGAQTALSNGLSMKRDRTRALEIGRLAAERHPESVIARTNLALLQLQAGDVDGAARTAGSVLADFPHPPPHAFVYLGAAALLRDRDDAAADAYRKLDAIDPSLAATSLADLAIFRGRLSDAAGILERGISLATARKDAEAAATKWAMLAYVRLRQGNTAGAVAAADKVTATGGPTARYAAAEVYVEAAHLEKSAAIASALSELGGQDPRMFARLVEGDTLRKMGKPRDALRAFTEARGISDSWLAHLGLGLAHLDLGEFAEAAAELDVCATRRGEAAFALADDNPTLRYLPQLTYYRARAEDGLERPEATASYAAFLATQPAGVHDARVDDARKRERALAARGTAPAPQ